MIFLISIIVSFLLFFAAVTIHEFAHAWAADKLGDPTPRIDGRLTLNPLAHIDKYGTVLLPLMLTLLRSPLIFGWAKPVIFDPYNLKNPKKDTMLIALAGPASNISMAILSSLVLRIFPESLFVQSIFIPFILLNITLAIFNMVPIHPLDGGKILVGLLPYRQSHKYDLFLHRYGMYLLILLILPLWGGNSILFTYLNPIIRTLSSLLIPYFTI